MLVLRVLAVPQDEVLPSVLTASTWQYPTVQDREISSSKAEFHTNLEARNTASMPTSAVQNLEMLRVLPASRNT